jgi:hypothetical protein
MSKLVNKNSSHYLLGNYSAVSVINIEKSLIFLKYSFSVLQKIFLKNGFIAFVVNKRGVLPTIYKFRRGLKYGILPGSRWNAGLISNYRTFYSGNIWNYRVPSGVIINFMKENNYAGERSRHPLFVLFLIDTIHNVLKFDNFVFINNKSFISLVYFYFVFINLIKKFIAIKKVRFFELVKKKVVAIFNKPNLLNKWQR